MIKLDSKVKGLHLKISQLVRRVRLVLGSWGSQTSALPPGPVLLSPASAYLRHRQGQAMDLVGTVSAGGDDPLEPGGSLLVPWVRAT